MLFLSCDNNDNFVFPDSGTDPVTVKTYTFDSESNSILMFQDGEPQDSLTSKWRRYEIGKVLRIKPVSNTRIEVANFAPIDIEEATIIATIDNLTKPVQLFRISKIRAHAIQIIDYPFINDSMFLNVDNEEVNLAEFMYKGIAPKKINFDFTGDNQTILKLKNLSKVNWKIAYHDYDPDNNESNNWEEDITAKDVRRYTGLMINLAAVFASDTFKNEFLKEIITGNSKQVLTAAEKEETYNELLEISYLECGKVVNVSGLGGGDTYGVAEHILRDYLYESVGEITWGM